jgi:drug/metabolite transporter (DMT)-like permease
MFLALSPVTATLLGAWLLGEPVSRLLAVGLASVVAGLALAHRRLEPRPRALALDSERGRAL